MVTLQMRDRKTTLAKSLLILGCVTCINLLIISCSSQSAKQLAQAEENNSADGEGQLVCRDVEVTGTRFKRQVCNTQVGWDALSKKNSVATDEFNRQTRESTSLVNPGTGPDGNGGMPSTNPNDPSQMGY